MEVQPQPSGRVGSENHVETAASWLRTKRVGLVLAGGGAKGAYQAGCVDYLRSIGLTDYYVVAGSSVGSLNGAAVASGKIPEIVEVWKQISLRQILVPSWRLLPFASGVLFLQAVRFAMIILAIGSLVTTALIWFALGFSAAFAVGLTLFAAFFLFATIPGFISLPFTIAAEKLDDLLPKHTSLAKPYPLRRLIRHILLDDRKGRLDLQCPMYATVTYKAYWFDPDFPSLADFAGLQHYLSEPDFDTPIESPGWLPDYVNLDDLSEDDLLDHLVASAALPFAFRQVAINGRHYVDGGVIDNVPLNKVLEFDCDAVIVIYLGSDINVDSTLEHIPRLRRAIRVSRMPLKELHGRYIDLLRRSHVAEAHGCEPTSDEYDLPWYVGLSYIPKAGGPYEAVPLEPLDHLPRFIEVVPSQALGGLLRGTLNFSRRKARKLLALGRHDMEKAISTFGYSLLNADSDSKPA